MRIPAVHALICVAMVSQGYPGGAASSSTPNVLMIVLDDVGWQDVGFHDSDFHTPQMNRLASEGVELTAFYASPECTPARSQLMTGRYNYKTGMQDSVIRSTEPRGLPLEEVILPEKLVEAGYQTAIVGKWHLGFHMKSYTPNHRGFQRQYGIYCGGGDHFTHLSESYSAEARMTDGELDQRYYRGPNLVEDGEISDDNDETSLHTTELYTRKSLEYLEGMTGSDKPWYLYLSFQAVHTPVEVDESWYADNSCASITAITGENEFPEADDDTSWIDRKKICGMMAQVDYGVGKIRAYLERVGQWDDTVVLLFSDNGGVSSVGSLNLPYRGEKGEYWEGGVRVPAVVAGGYTESALAAGLGASYKFKHMVHITDMHATVLRLAMSQFQASNATPGQYGKLGGGGSKARATVRQDDSEPAAAIRKTPSSSGVASGEVDSRSGSSSSSSSSRDNDLDGVDMWDAWTVTGEAARNTVVINVNSALFAFSGCVRHGKYKMIRNPQPDENRIWSKVRTALVDYGFFLPQAILANLANEAHDDLHLNDGGHMYLFDLEENPFERTSCNDGGNHVSCSNIYHHAYYADVREELEAIMKQAYEDSAHSTFQWQDDGPLSDPFNFGGWLPWRDDEGYPRVQYGGAYVPSAPSKSVAAPQYNQVLPPKRISNSRSTISSLPVFAGRGTGNGFLDSRRGNGSVDSQDVKQVKVAIGVGATAAGQVDLVAVANAAAAEAKDAADVAAAAVAAADAAAKKAAAAAAAAKQGSFTQTGGAAYHVDVVGKKAYRERATNGLIGQEPPSMDFAQLASSSSSEEASYGTLFTIAEVAGVVVAGLVGIAIALAILTALRGGPKHDYTRLIA